MDTFKLSLLKQFGAELATICPKDGYINDLRPTPEVPQRIFRGRTKFGASDPIPMLSIVEDPDMGKNKLSKKNASAGQYVNYHLLVQGWCMDDADNPTDPAHLLQADVRRKIGLLRESTKNSEKLFDFPRESGTVLRIDQGEGLVRPPDKESSKAYFWLEVWFEIYENPSQPYLTQ